MAPSRDRLLDAAVDLLQRQGYHGTGLNELLERSEAPRGSLYHYFPGGKEQIGAEAIGRAGRAGRRRRRAPAARQAVRG